MANEDRPLLDRLYWKLRHDPEWNEMYAEIGLLIDYRNQLAALREAAKVLVDKPLRGDNLDTYIVGVDELDAVVRLLTESEASDE